MKYHIACKVYNLEHMPQMEKIASFEEKYDRDAVLNFLKIKEDGVLFEPIDDVDYIANKEITLSQLNNFVKYKDEVVKFKTLADKIKFFIDTYPTFSFSDTEFEIIKTPVIPIIPDGGWNSGCLIPSSKTLFFYEPKDKRMLIFVEFSDWESQIEKCLSEYCSPANSR